MKYNQRIFKRAVVQILCENGFTLADLCDWMGVEYEQMYNWFSILNFIPSDTCEAIFSAIGDLVPNDWFRENPDWKKLDALEYNLAADVYNYINEVVQLLNAASDIKNIKEKYPTLHMFKAIGWKNRYTLAQVFNRLNDLLDKEIQLQEEVYAFAQHVASLHQPNTSTVNAVKPITAPVLATTDQSQSEHKLGDTFVEVDSDTYAELLRVSNIVDIPVSVIVNSILKKKLNGN